METLSWSKSLIFTVKKRVFLQEPRMIIMSMWSEKVGFFISNYLSLSIANGYHFTSDFWSVSIGPGNRTKEVKWALYQLQKALTLRA